MNPNIKDLILQKYYKTLEEMSNDIATMTVDEVDISIHTNIGSIKLWIPSKRPGNELQTAKVQTQITEQLSYNRVEEKYKTFHVTDRNTVKDIRLWAEDVKSKMMPGTVMSNLVLIFEPDEWSRRVADINPEDAKIESHE